MNKNDWHACCAYNLYNTQVVFGVADCSWLPKPCPMRFVAFDYQNTGIADQTEEEPLIKAEICLALSQEKDNRNWSQWQWGGSSKSGSCACSSSILCVSNLVSWFWLARIPGFTYIHHVQTPWLMPGVLQRASEGAGLGFIRAAWFLHRIYGKDAGSVLLRIFATFSNMTKAYLFASHVLLQYL